MLVIKTCACLQRFLRQISVPLLAAHSSRVFRMNLLCVMYNRFVMIKFKVVRVTASSVHVTDSGYFYMTRSVNNMKVASEKVQRGLKYAALQGSNGQP